MNEESASLVAARAEQEQARQRFVGTLDELQKQFAPHTLMREAWATAREKGAELAEDAVDAVRRRPLTATGIVAGIALFIAREPLMDLAGRLAKSVTGKEARKKEPKTTSTENVA